MGGANIWFTFGECQQGLGLVLSLERTRSITFTSGRDGGPNVGATGVFTIELCGAYVVHAQRSRSKNCYLAAKAVVRGTGIEPETTLNRNPVVRRIVQPWYGQIVPLASSRFGDNAYVT